MSSSTTAAALILFTTILAVLTPFARAQTGVDLSVGPVFYSVATFTCQTQYSSTLADMISAESHAGIKDQCISLGGCWVLAAQGSEESGNISNLCPLYSKNSTMSGTTQLDLCNTPHAFLCETGPAVADLSVITVNPPSPLRKSPPPKKFPKKKSPSPHKKWHHHKKSPPLKQGKPDPPINLNSQDLSSPSPYSLSPSTPVHSPPTATSPHHSPPHNHHAPSKKSPLKKASESSITSPPPATAVHAPPPKAKTPPPHPFPAPPTPLEVNLTSAYEILPQKSEVVAVHMVHIPGTDTYLYMERPSGYHPDGSHNIAGSFDLVSRVWTHLSTPSSLFCSGHSVMSNGSVVIMGGHIANAGFADGRWGIRTFSNGDSGLINVTNMRYPRWYPTVTLLPDERVMVMGGTQGVGAGTAGNPYYEIWDPRVPATTEMYQVLPFFLSTVKQNYYPFNFVLPTGDMFSFCASLGWILNPYNGTYKQMLPFRPTSIVAPGTSWITQYPYTGTSLMLTLTPANNYAADIMIIGGQNVNANRDLSLTACSESLRISISYPKPPSTWYNYNGGWEIEATGSPRVMPDSVLLPNGVVILLNGAMEGLAGDAASGGGSRAFYPNFFAEMYQPSAPSGQRWTSLSRSQIPRLYHSGALLTTNGTILVSGCDRCANVVTNMTYSPAPVKAEYRNEIFYPPFWYDFKSKPLILSWPQEVTYGQTFNVTYTGLQDPSIVASAAVMVAPGSVTHSFNTNQRTIQLVMISDPYSKTLTLTAPPTANHAPPQLYMLFLLNGQAYSTAVWVKLVPAS
ncbi:hypothetical protein CEUSTIGMA_g6619.t1 [Chlamydomonas eustigma]|uniref:Galactose oxidase-like Early set domain-containing protein n=1 Tax=Chlamydomonas eustigma TaxID=1157962 RepID=A0A250X8C8_9CHLO|nr:hypothetical protein CEUSTIGMA_g6619.t1 [Chlamydomonas eustigma]|eukprot:GAX79179.1 hypothetical protein CEUSTIGMA_g6619.t1 [Chlamydomonas eustigma]